MSKMTLDGLRALIKRAESDEYPGESEGFVSDGELVIELPDRLKPGYWAAEIDVSP